MINIGIEPTAHRRSLRFYLKKILQYEIISKSSIGLRFDDLTSENSPWEFLCFTSFFGILMLNSNLKSVFKKFKIDWVRAKKLTKNINKLRNRNLVPLFGHNFLYLNFIKNGFRIWIQHSLYPVFEKSSTIMRWRN